MSWYQEFDESTHKSLEQFKTPEDLAKSYIETKSMVGNSIVLPGKDAGEDDQKKFHENLMSKVDGLMLKPNFDDQEQSDSFYKMAGKPDEATKYEADVPEGFTPNEDRAKLLKDIAFESGLSKKQYKGIMEKVYAADLKVQQSAKDEFTKESDALKLEWGSAYDTKIDTAVALSNQFFGELFTKETMPSKFAQGLDKLSAQFSKEDINITNPNEKTVMTPAEAQSAIREIYNNPKHPFFSEVTADNMLPRKRMVELNLLANPEKQ